MFHPVVGNDELRLRGEALEDGGLDGRFNKIPSSSRFSPDRFVPVRVIFPGSADLMDEVQSTDNCREAHFVMKKTQNIFLRRINWG